MRANEFVIETAEEVREVAPQATEPTLIQRAKNWIGLNILAPTGRI